MANKKKNKKMAKKAVKTAKKYPKVVAAIIIVLLIVVIVLGALWFTGKLDSYLPVEIQKTTLLDGKNNKPNEPENKEPIVVNGDVQIYSIEMHDKYGDSLFIKYGDYDILIDAGDEEDGAYVQSFVDSHISSDKNLDLLVVTHCHSDHMGGLVYAAKGSRALDNVSTISNIIDYGHSRDFAMHRTYATIRNEYISKGAKYYPAYEAVHGLDGLTNVLTFGELKVEIIDTNNYAPTTETFGSGVSYNEYSVATLITYKGVKLFCAGDLEDKGEASLIANASNTSLKDIKEEDNVIYKMCHHGTDVGSANDNASSDNGGNRKALLEIIKPDIVFVSSAIGESDHPFPRAVATCLYFTDKVYFNGTNGTLCMSTDGTNVQVTGEGATTNYTVEGHTIDYAAEKDLVFTETTWYKYGTFNGSKTWYKGSGTIDNPTIKDYTEWYLSKLRG